LKLLGVDVGTTSIKAAVYDQTGQCIISAHVDYELISKGDHVEFDADEYFDLFLIAVKETAWSNDISAIAIDTQCETLIMADEKGKPLCNAIVWLDNRAVAEACEIQKDFGRQKIYETTGQAEVTATWPACKLLWMKKNEPDIWKKVRKIFLLEDYLLFRLTGKFITEKTLQSSSLYFDIHKGGWWTEMLEYLNITPDMLPAIHDSGECIGNTGNITVVTGAIDQIAGAIGAGIVENGMVSEMTGTAMSIFAPSEMVPPYDPVKRIPCHYNYDGRYCLLSWTATAGMVLKWYKDNFCGGMSYKELDELACRVPAGCDGLTMLPYLCGSIAPYDPDARGMFHGISLSHTKGYFARSIMEAIACTLKSSLIDMGTDVSEIRSMGGAANSALWCQIKADITGCKIVTLKDRETACLGSAILAGVGIGAFDSVREACSLLVKTDEIYLPAKAAYEDIYDRFMDLRKAVYNG